MKKTISIMNALFLLLSLSVNAMAEPNEFYGVGCGAGGGDGCAWTCVEDIENLTAIWSKKYVPEQCGALVEEAEQRLNSQYRALGAEVKQQCSTLVEEEKHAREKLAEQFALQIEKGNQQIEWIKNQRVKKCICFDTPPVGEIISFAGNNVPDGYLPCDGRELDAFGFPELFKSIGTRWGAGSGTNFKVPDLRGVFLRGTGGNAAPLGQQQGDAIRNIVGGWTSYHEEATNAYGAFEVRRSWGNGVCGNCGSNDDVAFDASRVVPTANENRPVNYCSELLHKVQGFVQGFMQGRLKIVGFFVGLKSI
ncbi:MAG: phage tail protein [Endomicrobium sp.]|jgi:hypothetical protein|nr:phage tail protein [Endomicrobium sp.]